ncbi:uncharacterized protein LOC135828342 isoform X3 [Sycon ciliatum]|uniref:uncharacterized protein LOC135809702 isoform X2 n=1 Tax=Sycon ciliatum TaxID=27933 RepID=UPI0031F680FC
MEPVAKPLICGTCARSFRRPHDIATHKCNAVRAAPRAEYGDPRPVDNTSPGLPRMGPHSQSWQWKKEGSFHCPGATLTRTAIWCSRGVCRAANGASLIRRFDRRTREELMDDLSNVPLGSERRRVLTLGLGHSTAVPVWLPALPAFQPVAVSCHHSAATVFGTTVLMALMHSTAQARSHQLQASIAKHWGPLAI